MFPWQSSDFPSLALRLRSKDLELSSETLVRIRGSHQMPHPARFSVMNARDNGS